MPGKEEGGKAKKERFSAALPSARSHSQARTCRPLRAPPRGDGGRLLACPEGASQRAPHGGWGCFFFLLSDFLHTRPNGSSVSELHIRKAGVAGFGIFFFYAPPNPAIVRTRARTCAYAWLRVFAAWLQSAANGLKARAKSMPAPRARPPTAPPRACRTTADARLLQPTEA